MRRRHFIISPRGETKLGRWAKIKTEQYSTSPVSLARKQVAAAAKIIMTSWKLQKYILMRNRVYHRQYHAAVAHENVAKMRPRWQALTAAEK